MKSLKTLERIAVIGADLRAYSESIERLCGYGHKLQVCAMRDFTLRNIRTQMRLLEREIDVLMEYGA